MLILARAASLVLLWTGAGALTERIHHRHFRSSTLLALAEVPLGRDRPEPVLLRGRVIDDPVRARDRSHFLFAVREARMGGRWGPSSGRIRVSLRDPSARARIAYGDRLEIPVRLRPPRNFGNPGAFDYRRHLEGEGIHLLGTVKNARLVEHLPGRERSAAAAVHRMRQRLLRRLERAFPSEEDAEARRFLEAILLGQRRGTEGPFEDLFRKTGVYHILSISGLHFGLLLLGVGRAARYFPAGSLLGPWIQGTAALLYVALSGGDDPILRASLSAGLLGLGRWSGRRTSAWDAQAQAALLLLAIHPLHLFDPGFQLSFVATWGILAARGPWWQRLRGLPLAGESLAASASAWIVSAPVIAAHFSQVSPIALALNLPAAPFLSGSLLLGAALLILPAEPVAVALRLLLDLFSCCCRFSLLLPGAFTRVPPPSGPLLMAGGALLIARLSLAHRASQREARLLSAGVLLALAGISTPVAGASARDCLDFLALDVGQGDALLLRLPGGKNLLVDGGGFTGTDFDVGEKVVVPALLALGVQRLDLVVLTHAHQDHGGGLPAVVEAFRPREVWMGRMPPRSALRSRIEGIARRLEIPVRHPTRGTIHCLGEVCFEVLHPPSSYRPGAGSSNEDSLVLRATFRRTSILLTGDIEEEGESMILSGGSSARTDLLKVAHHGSDSSTSGAFLAAASPRAAVVSVGVGNSWGHPSPVVLERLSARRISLARTDRSGAVRFVSDGLRWRRKEPGD